jgi:copper oxidase (laccase) domain-containing protein
VTTPVPFETFPGLDLPFCAHAFIQRIPGLDVQADREKALARLEGYHSRVRAQLGFTQFAIGEQVHGAGIAVIAQGAGGDQESELEDQEPELKGSFPALNSAPWPPTSPIAGVDGLITNRPGLCLGVQVADCGAVYLVDPVRRCIGLVHSGRKGTELGIAPAAISKMKEAFGTDPADLLVQLGPCIRPPLYETDFAAEIIRQCRVAGAGNVFDCGANTGADLLRYYSYRVEKGKTGRMLALLGMKPRG